VRLGLLVAWALAAEVRLGPLVVWSIVAVR
jgi:hypothetical protein